MPRFSFRMRQVPFPPISQDELEEGKEVGWVRRLNKGTEENWVERGRVETKFLRKVRRTTASIEFLQVGTGESSVATAGVAHAHKT